MASIYSNPDYVAKLPKTGFPHYQPINFSSIPGALVPTYCCDLLPGEKISGDISQFTRTRELETAAMTDIDEFVDFFFVPAKKIYSIFGEWFFNIDDNPTALRPSVNEGRVKYLPSVSPSRLYTVFENANDVAYEASQDPSSSLLPDFYQFDTPSNGMVRLLAHMRFDVFSLFDSDQMAVSQRSRLWNIPLLPFLAYQAIYYDYYRDSNWQSNDVQAYNIDDWLTTLSQDTITDERLLKIFKLQYRRQNSDYYVNTKPSPLQNATSMLNIDGVRESALLAVNDWLSPAGLSFDFVQKEGANTAVVMGSPVPTDGVSNLSVSGNGGSLGSLQSDLVTIDVAYPKNGDWLNVQEHNILTNTGDVDNFNRSLLAGTEGLTTPVSLEGVVNNTNVKSANGLISGLSISSLSQALGTLKSSISSNGVRVMFALEKLAKITARAGKHYDDQVLAHFGFKIPKGVSNEVYYVGGAHGEVHIGEVISPSTTEGSVAGEIVGKGYGGVKNGHVEFVAPCHGYFFAIYSSAPRRTYTPIGSPKEYSQFEREDFVQPELMDLGMQPLFDTEFRPSLNYSDTIMGWQWRYQERKCRVPMAIGAFARFSDSDTTLNGALQDWTIQYPVLNCDHGVTGLIRLGYKNFLVNAQSFNSIMLLQWQPYFADHEDFHVSRVFDRDPLFHQYTNNLFLTSYMSTFGEPKLW